jgi:hypothetical protein
MTALAITGMGLTGVLRLTWVHDNLAHVQQHSQVDEPSGTWTGLACPGRGLPLGTDVDNAVLRDMAAGRELADLIWEAPDELAAGHAQAFNDAMHAHLAGEPERAGRLWENLQAIWSHAWSSNYAVLEFMQGTGLTRFAPVKPSSGSSPPSSTTPAPTAFPAPTSTTSPSPA